jgi:hypothetical protein
VQVSARNCRCAIEVVNTGSRDSEPVPDASGTDGDLDGRWPGGQQPDGSALADDPVSAVAEHGRGLKIIDALTDNLQLTGNRRQGTTLHFEKTLEWLPGAAGQHLFAADGGS